MEALGGSVAILAHVIAAFFGGWLLLMKRDDTPQTFLGWTPGAAGWNYIMFAYGFLVSLPSAYHAWWTKDLPLLYWPPLLAAFLCSLIVAGAWTPGHGPILRGPGADQRWDPDVLLRIVMKIWRVDPATVDACTLKGLHSKGENTIICRPRIGWPVWTTYCIVRYVPWTIAAGACLKNPYLALSGFGVVLAYWPIAHIVMGVKPKWDSRFVGAALAGAVVYGVI